MSERTYAPRSGGRTAEQRSTTETRRRTGAAEPPQAHTTRRPGPAEIASATRGGGSAETGTGGRRSATGAGTGRSGTGRSGTMETAGRRAGTGEPSARRAGASEASARRAGASGRRADTVDRDVVRGTRRSPTPGSSGGRPVTAPTEGTAALRLDAEPLRVTGTAEAAPRLRVAPPAPISAPRAPFIAMVIALVVAGVIGILLINTRTNENSFRISELQDRQTALDNQQQQLDNQIATYESSGNLDAAARRLGLVKAGTPAYIRLPDGRVIGVARPGGGERAVTAQDRADAATQQEAARRPATTPNGAGVDRAAQNG